MKRFLAVILIFTIFISSFAFSARSSVSAASKTGPVSVSEFINMLTWVAENEAQLAVDDPGYRYEASDGTTKYGKWFGDSTGAWCMMFLCWCYQVTDWEFGTNTLGNMVAEVSNQRVSCTDFYNKGRFHWNCDGYLPKKGDLVYFNWNGDYDWRSPSTRDKTYLWKSGSTVNFNSNAHVGLVVSDAKVTDGVVSFKIVDGNFSDKVMKRTISSNTSLFYYNTSRVVGFASPDYEGYLRSIGRLAEGGSNPEPSSTPTAQPTPTPTPVPTPTPGRTGTPDETHSPEPFKTPEPTQPPKTPAPKPTPGQTPVPADRKLKSFSLEHSTISIAPGEYMDDPIISRDPANTTETFYFYSENESVATVTQNGRIYGIAPGNTTVWCEASGGLRKSVAVTITGGSSGQPENTAAPQPLHKVTSMKVDNSWILLYIVDGDCEYMDIELTYSPEDTDERFYWYSEDDGIASVNQDGRIFAVSKGTTVIHCVSSEGMSATVEVEIMIRNTEDMHRYEQEDDEPVNENVIPVENMSLSASYLKLFIGEFDMLTLSCSPAENTEEFFWYVDDDDIALVTDSGRVIARKPGKTKVHVGSSLGKVVSCDIEVFDSNEVTVPGDERQSENPGSDDPVVTDPDNTPEPVQTPEISPEPVDPTPSASPSAAPSDTPTPSGEPSPSQMSTPSPYGSAQNNAGANSARFDKKTKVTLASIAGAAAACAAAISIVLFIRKRKGIL